MKLLLGKSPFSPGDEEEKLAFDLLEKVMLDAASERASDIHLEPFRDDSVIRFRVDGVMTEISRHGPNVIKSLIRVAKKISSLNPDVEEIPQEGKIVIDFDRPDGEARTFDFRLSTMPTIFGEKMVFRVLDPSSARRILKGELPAVGLDSEEIKAMEAILAKPCGLVIYSGPSGSGKTTTVYASLAHLANRTRGRCSIMSLEEPVECAIDGVIQTQVNRDGEFNYLRALKAAMRQDPDIVFVADIPDLPAAQMVLQAALTGHLILTQVAAGDAAQAVHNFFKMGVEPYLISMILEGITSQRLVRTICPGCKKKIPAKKEIIHRFREDIDNPEEVTYLYKGEGCPQCRNSGYRGRTAIYQIIPRNEKLVDLMARQPSLAEMRKEMDLLGYPSLRKAAIRKAIEGVTTMEEALRSTYWT